MSLKLAGWPNESLPSSLIFIVEALRYVEVHNFLVFRCENKALASPTKYSKNKVVFPRRLAQSIQKDNLANGAIL